MTTADFNASIRKVRAQVQDAAAKLGLDAAEDVAELPIVISNDKRVRSVCGHFQHVAANGLGRITIFRKMCRDVNYFESILLHEFAHALVHYLRDGEEDPTGAHGKTFAYVMLTLGQEPSRFVMGASDRDPATVYEKK